LRVLAILNERDAPRRLEIEITESALVQDPQPRKRCWVRYAMSAFELPSTISAPAFKPLPAKLQDRHHKDRPQLHPKHGRRA
jgi:hypothetical protein